MKQGALVSLIRRRGFGRNFSWVQEQRRSGVSVCVESSEGQTVWGNFLADPSPWGDSRSNTLSLPGTWPGEGQEEKLNEVVEALNQLVAQRFYVPNRLLYGVLEGCITRNDLGGGRRVHALTLETGQHGPSTFLANHIIRMYASHGMLQEAAQVFASLATPNTFSWYYIISAHAEHGQPKEAIRLYQQMRGSLAKADSRVFVAALKACGSAADLECGKQVHADILDSLLEPDMFLGCSLVDMYAKCQSLGDARRVFDQLGSRDVVTWTAMISGYTQHGCGQEALSLYRDMQLEGVTPADRITFMCLLKACASIGALHVGKDLHVQIQEKGLESDVVVGNCLVDMYAKCGRLEDARTVFDKLAAKDAVSWTAMISGYLQHGLGQEALALYSCMPTEDKSLFDPYTFVCLLKACSSVRALEEGKQVHNQIRSRGLEADVVIGCSLVEMYAKCCSLEDASRVFDGLLSRDVVTWNTMIAAYAEQGLGQEAFMMYARMREEGLAVANSVTFLGLLKACATSGILHQGKHLHFHIKDSGLEADVAVGSSLVDMYVKCGSLKDARKVFESLPTKNVVTWTAMISGYVDNGLCQEALSLYETMERQGIIPADHVTFVCLLKACASVGALHQGKQLYSQIQEKGLETNVLVAQSVVDMFARCSSLEDARRVFDNLPVRDVETWTAMIAGYAQHGMGQEALSLYARMKQECLATASHVTYVCLLKACASIGSLAKGKELHCEIRERGLDADVTVGNSLVDMYAKCGSVEDARRVFDQLSCKDTVTWNAMIAGYAQHGLGQEALSLYEYMQDDSIAPANHVTYICLLKACASVGAFHQGKSLHLLIQKTGLDTDVVLGSVLVDMYAKCSSLEEARRVFDELPTRNVVTWNSLLNACGQHNDGRRAVQFFQEMEQHGIEPDGSTFLCLLVACSHTGLVHEAKQYFKMMVDEHGITPSVYHYNCMVDVLGRSGQLDEAEQLLRSIRSRHDLVGWISLLTACRSHADVERGRRCFDQIIKLDPKNAAAYVLLGNILANAGRWSEVERIETLRRSAGACKKPAKAWIEVNSKVHDFTVGEERGDVSSKLRSVNLRLEEGGHVPHTDLVLKPVSEKEKEDALCGHAEKLALAFGLLNTPDGTMLLVTKNLRMCDDCHSGTKIMSKLEKREIIVRDAHRVHHFVNGFCSCGDYL